MDAPAQVEIPNRALFKAAEVCDLAKLQPYVLRSWESEFPQLGVAKSAGAPRVYRRADVEQVLRIRHLLLVEGLTLAGARRRLEDETAPVVVDAPAIEELAGRNARERLTAVKRGLRSILDLLSESGRAEFRLEPQVAATIRKGSGRNGGRAIPARRAKPSRGNGKVAGRNGAARAPHPRRKAR